MNKEKLLHDLGYGILFQLGEGPCTAGCEICYERPAAIRHLTTKGLIGLSGVDAPDNKHLAGIMAQHVTVRKLVDINRRQKIKNSPSAFVLPWF